jgi:uncharacterized protein (TIGR04255 family)
MVDRPTDLPDYEHPPLVEVVLSVQFAELQAYRTVHAGLLWEQKFRRSYPLFAEQAPINPVFEVFGPRQGLPQVQLRQMPGPQVPRLWFMNNQQTELIQIQADRFLRNWRKAGTGEEYPRYENLREHFFNDLTEINEFFRSWNIGTIQPNQCEITYVNRLELEGNDIRACPGVALKLFPTTSLQLDSQVVKLPDPEDCNLVVRYVFRDAQGKPRGRLQITAQAWPNEPALRLDLTVRGAPQAASLEAVANFFDEGRNTIVHSFTAITREQMHRQWGRVQ